MFYNAKTPAPSRRNIVVDCALALWVLALMAALYFMSAYERAPGPEGTAPLVWPSASVLNTLNGDFTLVMFVHPQCPCSRASLDELNVIMNSADARRSKAYAVFVSPPSTDEHWLHTYSWERAGQIPGVLRYVDHGGVEAHRFGAQTSGDLLLYDGRGQLEFRGGITSARGAEGDNIGRQSVLRLLAGSPVPWQTHAVFGCALLDSPALGKHPKQDTKP